MPLDPITAGLGLTKALLPLVEKAGTALYHVVREHATVSGGMTVCRRRITAAESLVRPWVGNDHLAKGPHESFKAAHERWEDVIGSKHAGADFATRAVELIESIEEEESWYKRFQLCRECRHACHQAKTYAYVSPFHHA
jgi:hypothetical protein